MKQADDKLPEWDFIYERRAKIFTYVEGRRTKTRGIWRALFAKIIKPCGLFVIEKKFPSSFPRKGIGKSFQWAYHPVNPPKKMFGVDGLKPECIFTERICVPSVFSKYDQLGQLTSKIHMRNKTFVIRRRKCFKRQSAQHLDCL